MHNSRALRLVAARPRYEYSHGARHTRRRSVDAGCVSMTQTRVVYWRGRFSSAFLTWTNGSRSTSKWKIRTTIYRALPARTSGGDSFGRCIWFRFPGIEKTRINGVGRMIPNRVKKSVGNNTIYVHYFTAVPPYHHHHHHPPFHPTELITNFFCFSVRFIRVDHTGLKCSIAGNESTVSSELEILLRLISFFTIFPSRSV